MLADVGGDFHRFGGDFGEHRANSAEVGRFRACVGRFRPFWGRRFRPSLGKFGQFAEISAKGGRRLPIWVFDHSGHVGLLHVGLKCLPVEICVVGSQRKFWPVNILVGAAPRRRNDSPAMRKLFRRHVRAVCTAAPRWTRLRTVTATSSVSWRSWSTSWCGQVEKMRRDMSALFSGEESQGCGSSHVAVEGWLPPERELLKCRSISAQMCPTPAEIAPIGPNPSRKSANLARNLTKEGPISIDVGPKSADCC